jgi:hypothetical protein
MHVYMYVHRTRRQQNYARICMVQYTGRPAGLDDCTLLGGRSTVSRGEEGTQARTTVDDDATTWTWSRCLVFKNVVVLLLRFDVTILQRRNHTHARSVLCTLYVPAHQQTLCVVVKASCIYICSSGCLLLVPVTRV